MKGTINAIWLTNNGKLHPKVAPNLAVLVEEATTNDFQVVLWTNKKQVSETDIRILTDQNIIVKDYSECSSSKFYDHFINFFDKGMQGDKAAFALASDILRMSVLELLPNDQYYIYFDPNDVTFPNFGQSLRKLDQFMSLNSLGFSFYVTPLFSDMKVFHQRNDVLIAKKEINLQFFQDYLAAYAAHLDSTASTYFKPQTDKEAQDLARQISNQTDDNFFRVLLTKPTPQVISMFGSYGELYTLVDCSVAFSYERHKEDANTWLPNGLCLEEDVEIEKLRKEHTIPPSRSRVQNYLIDDEPYSVRDNSYQTNLLDDLLRPVSSLIEQLFLMPGDRSFSGMLYTDVLGVIPKMLMPPPERKMITLPDWENARKTRENPSLQRSLPISFFRQAYKAYITEHRHDNPQLQEEYDQQYGLVVRK